MGVVDALRIIRTPRTAEVPRIAAALREDAATGLLRLARFVDTLETRIDSPDTRLAALEGLRPTWIAVLEPQIEGLRNRPIPFAADELAAFHRVASALRAVRDAYKRVHADLRADMPEGPESPVSMRALLALARALDAQSRLLDGAGRLRVAMRRDDWDDLCRLAFPLWSAGALDESFPDVSRMGGGRTVTPRAAFVTPLLMRLLEPLGLSGAALEHAHRVARHSARRAGVRIDVDGLPHVSADGPALMLSVNHTVRLDTRDAHALILRCREQLAQGASPASIGLRTFLSPAAVDALLAQLASVWGPCHVPTPLVRPPLAQALLLVGLPHDPQVDDEPALVDDTVAFEPSLATDAAPESASPYVYGRATGGGFEFGTEAHLEPGAQAAAGADAAAQRDTRNRELMQRIGQPVGWRGQDARRAVFSRGSEGPRLRLGQLVAVMPVRAAPRGTSAGRRRPGSGPSRLLVGTVVTLAQTGAADSREPFGHDVGVEFWPGAPMPVRVRFAATSGHEDAWWFPVAAGGAPASLVLRRDRFEGAAEVTVRDASGERMLRMLRLIERGIDHDRVEVAPIG
ncbi:MAG: hypothetical protein EHM87_08520 [Burkholderiales bacterium]|nr:MAG: hypothetical protein EHM87_08520 [Burkholderiales bacterium]